MNMWNGDATTAVLGISGAWGNTDADAWVDQNLSRTSPSKARLVIGEGGGARYGSYFVGQPGGAWWAMYSDRNGKRSVINDSVNFEVSGSGCSHTAEGCPDRKMARVDDAMCHFTRIDSAFKGWGEWVRIYAHPDGHWHLGMSNYQGYTTAAARCFSRKQGL